MLDQYEINKYTMAIVPAGNKFSKILEDNDDFIIRKTSTEVIDDSCKFFGSSYLGRFEGTKSMIGFNYKAPIIIEETREIIFFPTSSPRFENCIWISLKHLANYEKTAGNSKISFKNGQELDLPISYASLENQILRATRLESILRQRKTEENKLI